MRMKISIVTEDKIVGVDGVFFEVPDMDLENIPTVHAVQADTATGMAEIEYIRTPAQWDVSTSPPTLVTPECHPGNEVVSMAEFRRRFGAIMALYDAAADPSEKVVPL